MHQHISYIVYTQGVNKLKDMHRSQDSLVSLLLTDGGEGAEEEVRGVGIEGATVRAEGEELTAEGL